jgi:c-di-GMP-binding flagellar brake protein YcgR
MDDVENNLAEDDAPLVMNALLQVRLEGDKDSSGYHSRVEDIFESRLVISWPTNKGIKLPVHVNQVLDLSLVRDGIPYAFRGLVEKTTSEPIPQVTLTLSSSVIRVQRRQNVRVKCFATVEVTGTISADIAGSEGKPQIVTFKIATYDLSAGGMSIRHSTQIPEGTLLEAKLELPDRGPLIKIPCRVVHSEKIPRSTNMYHTGILFLALSESERSRIVRHLYRKQIEGIHS